MTALRSLPSLRVALNECGKVAQYNPSKRDQDGFSLATVMLIALAVILGSIAMIDRATSGWLGSLFVGQSREARDAAEIGLMRVVSQLNRSRNRRLLVNASLLNNEDFATLEAEGSSTTSHCASNEDAPPDLSTGGLQHARGELTGTSITAAEQVIDPNPRPANGTQRSYRVIAITQPNSSSELTKNTSTGAITPNPNFTVSIGDANTTPTPGEITITVQGFVRRGGTTVASTTISETLEVVPKCCGRSFAGQNAAFGNDSRRCDWPQMGIIVGTNKESDEGGIIARGAAVSFNIGTQGTPLNYVLCISDECPTNSTLNPNTGTIIQKDTTVDIGNIAKLISNRTCEGNGGLSKCTISLSQAGVQEALSEGVLTLDASNLDSWPSAFRDGDICKAAAPVSITANNGETTQVTDTDAIHCSISKLDFGANGRAIKFTNTQSHPVRLHFPNNQNPSSNKTIDQRNNGSFIHEITSEGKTTDLTLLGCPSCGTQYVDIGNGSGETLNMFAYFRDGVVSIGGNGAYAGVLWANNINVNGSINFNVPNGAVADALSLLGMEGPAADQETPMIDWIARSIKSFKLF